jgi:cytochrome bd-type quinol oxidase subunit 2
MESVFKRTACLAQHPTVIQTHALLVVALFLITDLCSSARKTFGISLLWPQFYVHGFFLTLFFYSPGMVMWAILSTWISLCVSLWIRRSHFDHQNEDSVKSFYIFCSTVITTILVILGAGFGSLPLLLYSLNNLSAIHGNTSFSESIIVQIIILSWDWLDQRYAFSRQFGIDVKKE